MSSIRLEIEIASTTISLDITYKFLRGAPETGPSYSSGGEPADSDEVEIESIDWAPVVQGIVGTFNQPGALIDILINDEWIYNQICEAEYANS